MGATVQVNTSCQSVRFSRRPKPSLPVGINLTLLIPSPIQTDDQKQPLPAFTSPLQRVCTKTAHSANSAGSSLALGWASEPLPPAFAENGLTTPEPVLGFCTSHQN